MRTSWFITVPPSNPTKSSATHPLIQVQLPGSTESDLKYWIVSTGFVGPFVRAASRVVVGGGQNIRKGGSKIAPVVGRKLEGICGNFLLI